MLYDKYRKEFESSSWKQKQERRETWGTCWNVFTQGCRLGEEIDLFTASKDQSCM